MVFDRFDPKEAQIKEDPFKDAPSILGRHGLGDILHTLHKHNFTRDEAPQHCVTALAMVLANRGGDMADVY